VLQVWSRAAGNGSAEECKGGGSVACGRERAGVFAVPVRLLLAGRTDMSLAFIGAPVLFLPLFVFLPQLVLAGDEGGHRNRD
jgi:hypothetical protein